MDDDGYFVCKVIDLHRDDIRCWAEGRCSDERLDQLCDNISDDKMIDIAHTIASFMENDDEGRALAFEYAFREELDNYFDEEEEV
jgi:hypothetical protein